jgi:hypothetical protein
MSGKFLPTSTQRPQGINDSITDKDGEERMTMEQTGTGTHILSLTFPFLFTEAPLVPLFVALAIWCFGLPRQVSLGLSPVLDL